MHKLIEGFSFVHCGEVFNTVSFYWRVLFRFHCSKSIDSEILFGEVHLSIFGELAHFFFSGPQVSVLSSSMMNAKFIQKL